MIVGVGQSCNLADYRFRSFSGRDMLVRSPLEIGEPEQALQILYDRAGLGQSVSRGPVVTDVTYEAGPFDQPERSGPVRSRDTGADLPPES